MTGRKMKDRGVKSTATKKITIEKKAVLNTIVIIDKETQKKFPNLVSLGGQLFIKEPGSRTRLATYETT